jgi:hypothetical protein
MIETGNADLSYAFMIRVVECDCELDFPGYSVQRLGGATDLFRLAKLSSLA